MELRSHVFLNLERQKVRKIAECHMYQGLVGNAFFVMTCDLLERTPFGVECGLFY